MILEGGNADLRSHPHFYSRVFKWASIPLTQCLMRVLLFLPALIIHHSSVVPVWIERSMSLIQEGSCCNSFLRFESVCSKLKPDLKWRSMEVWQDHRLVLITEAFEQCTPPLRQDGREMCFHASCNSFSLIWLGPCGRMSLQILAWHGAESRGWKDQKEPTVVLQSFVFIHILLIHWQKSAGIFFFTQQRKLTLGDAKCSTSVV